MEAVIELDRQYGLDSEAKDASETWITALSAFNTANAEVFDFVDRFGLENKTNFLLILTKRIISDALSPQAQVEFVRAIRLCFRETEGTKTVLTKDLVLKLVSLAHLDDLQFSVEGNPQHSILVNESLKVLVNLLISHRDTSRPLYLELDFPFKLMIALTGPSITAEMAFSVTRILRHLSIQDAETKKQLLENDLLSVLTTVLSKLEAEIRTDDGLRASKEIADLIYMITTHLGPLEGANPPNANELANFQTLVKIFQNYLFLPIADEKFHSLKESTVKCLINVPAACTQLFDHMRTLSSLIEILQYEAFKAGDPAQNLTPILLILSSIARGIPQSREIIKNVVFPDNEGVESHDIAVVPEVYGKEGTLSSKIIRQMTSSNYGLHYYACDFVYLICDEEMDEVVRLTGFGNAAGVIATHQVLSGLGGGKASGFKPQGETSDIAQHFIQPQEDIYSSSSSSSSSSFLEVASEPAQSQGEPRREMSEEEAERLMGMIERMEKLGVIKVMRKSDSDQ